MASRTLEINGAELSYFEAGEGPPVVLVNGILADQRSWRRQIEALSPKYRVFALSPRYYWPNKWPDDGAGFGVATFVADLVALLRKLDLPPVHLLGHSFGGGVVSEFAVQYPGLVCSLVLAEPAVFTIALDDPAMMSAIAEFGENRKAIFNEWQSGKREKAVDKLLLSIIGSKAVERIRDEHLGILYENADILGAAFRPRPLPAAVHARTGADPDHACSGCRRRDHEADVPHRLRKAGELSARRAKNRPSRYVACAMPGVARCLQRGHGAVSG